MAHITITLTGSDTATCDGQTITGGGGSQLFRLARQLVDSGYDAALNVEVMRGDTICFEPTTLGYFAGRSISEPANGNTIKSMPWQPMPDDLHTPA